MARSKYINTFDTTAEYNNYIESALPSFPNVGYDKESDKVNIVRTSPNAHVWYGEVVDPSQPLPTISLDNTTNTPTLDELNNAFYLDSWSNAAPTRISFGNKKNIKAIKKLQLDTSNVTTMNYMFYGCSSLTSLDLSNFNTSNVTDMNNMFYGCTSLTSLNLSNCDMSKVTSVSGTFNGCFKLKDVYITEESTLMKLTNNLTSEGSGNGNYIISSATIHYNGTDYKWTGSAWTPQS